MKVACSIDSYLCGLYECRILSAVHYIINNNIMAEFIDTEKQVPIRTTKMILPPAVWRAIPNKIILALMTTFLILTMTHNDLFLTTTFSITTTYFLTTTFSLTMTYFLTTTFSLMKTSFLMHDSFLSHNEFLSHDDFFFSRRLPDFLKTQLLFSRCLTTTSSLRKTSWLSHDDSY